MNHPNKAAIIGKLRELARYMPQKKEALRMALNQNERGLRGGMMYKCNHCENSYPAKSVQVDHIQPVVPVDRDLDSWDEYINRLFCDVSNLQVLCKHCHLVKTNLERAQRANRT